MLVSGQENYLKDIYSLLKRVRSTLQYLARKFTAYLEDLGNGYNVDCDKNDKP